MMLNAFQNKRRGPGGSARRIHQYSWFRECRRVRNRFDTRGKGKVCIRDGTVVSGRFIFANDNFVVANDNTFTGDVAIAA